MRNDNCRVTIIHSNGKPMARGFIADQSHVLTCWHNIKMCLGRPPEIGDEVEVETNSARRLRMRVIKPGDETNDVCSLGRADGGLFALTDCALWRRGASGTRYYGLGMSKNFANTPLSGELKSTLAGGRLQLVTGLGLDNRVEPGCSGAALFEEPDGPLLGMVTTYQQDTSGTIYAAESLAQFWPTLARFDAASTEALPSLFAISAEIPPVRVIIRDVDRTSQKLTFRRAIEDGKLLTSTGFVIAGFAALYDDLPDACVDGLYHWAISPMMRKLAPDSTKTVEPSRLSLRDVIGDGTEVRANLLDLLRNCLNAPSSAIEDVRTALRTTLTPLTLVLNAVAKDLDQLTPDVVRACGNAIRELAIPEEDQPVAVFIYVLAQEAGSLPDIKARLADIDIWCVPLKPLEPIRVNEVTNWTAEHYLDSAESSRARDKISDIIAANCGGRQEFRLKELKSWLSTVN